VYGANKQMDVVIAKGTNIGECKTEKIDVEVHCRGAHQDNKIYPIKRDHPGDKLIHY
jgi:hypothetical protein